MMLSSQRGLAFSGEIQATIRNFLVPTRSVGTPTGRSASTRHPGLTADANRL